MPIKALLKLFSLWACLMLGSLSWAASSEGAINCAEFLSTGLSLDSLQAARPESVESDLLGLKAYRAGLEPEASEASFFDRIGLYRFADSQNTIEIAEELAYELGIARHELQDLINYLVERGIFGGQIHQSVLLDVLYSRGSDTDRPTQKEFLDKIRDYMNQDNNNEEQLWRSRKALADKMVIEVGRRICTDKDGFCQIDYKTKSLIIRSLYLSTLSVLFKSMEEEFSKDTLAKHLGRRFGFLLSGQAKYKLRRVMKLDAHFSDVLMLDTDMFKELSDIDRSLKGTTLSAFGLESLPESLAVPIRHEIYKSEFVLSTSLLNPNLEDEFERFYYIAVNLSKLSQSAIKVGATQRLRELTVKLNRIVSITKSRLGAEGGQNKDEVIYDFNSLIEALRSHQKDLGSEVRIILSLMEGFLQKTQQFLTFKKDSLTGEERSQLEDLIRILEAEMAQLKSVFDAENDKLSTKVQAAVQELSEK